MISGLEPVLKEHLRRHRDDGVLLDTNVLLLWLMGQFKPNSIGGKRLEKYAVEDLSLIHISEPTRPY